MGLSENEEENLLAYSLIAVATLSTLCSLAIILVYCIVKEIRSFYMRLILLMVSSDTVNSVAYMLPVHNEATCYVQSLLTQLGATWSVFWSSVIAYALYRQIVILDEEIEQKQWKFVAFAYGSPMILFLIPFVTDSYGDAQGWCWIKASGSDYLKGTILRMICFYIPLVILLSFNFYSYLRVIKRIKGDLEGYCSEKETGNQITRKLVLYPMVLVFCYSPAAAKRIYDFISPNDPVFALNYVAGVLIVMIGLINFITYGLTDLVRKSICKCYFGHRERRSQSVAGVCEAFEISLPLYQSDEITVT